MEEQKVYSTHEAIFGYQLIIVKDNWNPTTRYQIRLKI